MHKIDEIHKIFKSLKIKENFIIIHSDIVGLGFKNFSISRLWEIIFDALGKNKTYILPTFTFTRKKRWDLKNSQSETGVLSEYFRKYIGSRRTVHPIHSVSIYGKNSNDIPEHNCSSSFGKGSVWEWLCRNKNVCNLSLGVELEGGASICHFPEEFVGVKYRNYIQIKDKIIVPPKKKILSKYSYYARTIKKNLEGNNDWSKCEEDLIKSKILKRKYFFNNKYPISKMNTYYASNFIINKLKKNQFYLGNFFSKK